MISILVLLIGLQGSPIFAADELPDLPGVDIQAIPTDERGVPPVLPPKLLAMVEEKARQGEDAPTWVRDLQLRKLSHYFPETLTPQTKLSEQSLAQLIADASALSEYYEANDPKKDFKDFVRLRLKPYIKKITAKKLLGKAKNPIGVKNPLKDWTVETLVLTQQLVYLSRHSNFFKRGMEMVTGPHMRGATRFGVSLIIVGASVGALHFLDVDRFVLGFVSASLLGGFNAGPVAAVINAGSGWFLNPTTETIRVQTARYTGWLEQRIHYFYDWLFSTSPQEQSSSVGDRNFRNNRPRIASIEKDGMNFAGMTPEDQKENWEKNLKMWVAVHKRFGQLLRDTHHAGRVLMMISWSDEQGSTQMIEAADTKLVGLGIEAEQVIVPFKTAFLIRGEQERKEALESVLDRFQELCASTWLQLNLNENQIQEIFLKVEETIVELKSFGLSERDIEKLKDIQATRAKAVGTIVTALAMNEIRSFNTAEANRNLEQDAREAQRVIRKGFQLQKYVDQYLPLVQQAQREMGYKNSGVQPIQRDCKSVVNFSTSQ